MKQTKSLSRCFQFKRKPLEHSSALAEMQRPALNLFYCQKLHRATQCELHDSSLAKCFGILCHLPLYKSKASIISSSQNHWLNCRSMEIKHSKLYRRLHLYVNDQKWKDWHERTQISNFETVSLSALLNLEKQHYVTIMAVSQKID